MTPDAELQIFAIKRGQLEQRIDVSFYLPSMTEVLTKIKNSKYEVVHLNKLLDDLTDGTHYTPSYTEKGVKFISVTNITENKIDFENTKYISEKEHSEFIRRCNPESNSILLTKIGSIGRAAVIPESCPTFSIFVSVALLKVNKKIIPDFLCAYLNSSLALRQFERYLKGIGVPDLHLENIAQTQIIVPDRDEQKKFARDYMNAFANYQNKLLAAEELLAGMDEFVLDILGIKKQNIPSKIIFGVKYANVYKGRIDAIFNNPHFVTRIATLKELPHDSLENIIEFSDEVWNGKDFFEDVFQYIEISNVGLKNNICYSNATSMEKIPSRAKMVVRNGDIIVSTTRPHRGAIAMLTFEKEQVKIASTGFSVLRNLKRSDILKEYLYWVLLNDYVLQQMLQRSSGGNYPAINQDELKKIIIPIPSIDKQKKIIAEAERRKKLSAHLKNEAEKEWQDAREQFEKELLGE